MCMKGSWGAEVGPGSPLWFWLKPCGVLARWINFGLHGGCCDVGEAMLNQRTISKRNLYLYKLYEL